MYLCRVLEWTVSITLYISTSHGEGEATTSAKQTQRHFRTFGLMQSNLSYQGTGNARPHHLPQDMSLSYFIIGDIEEFGQECGLI